MTLFKIYNQYDVNELIKNMNIYTILWIYRYF